jgi:hypothetical protein
MGRLGMRTQAGALEFAEPEPWASAGSQKEEEDARMEVEPAGRSKSGRSRSDSEWWALQLGKRKGR